MQFTADFLAQGRRTHHECLLQDAGTNQVFLWMPEPGVEVQDALKANKERIGLLGLTSDLLE